MGWNSGEHFYVPKNPKNHRIEFQDDFDAVLDYSSNPVEVFQKVKLPCGDHLVLFDNMTTPWWCDF